MNRFSKENFGQNIQHNQDILPDSQQTQRKSYTIPEMAGAHLDVVIRNDGKRSVSSFYIPEESQNEGLGQKLLLEALKDGPLVWKDNITPEANRVYQKLVEKGLAKSTTDEFGWKLIQLANRFSKEEWIKQAQNSTFDISPQEYNQFNLYVRSLSQLLSNEPDEYLLDLTKLRDRGVNYATWYLTWAGHELEVQFSFLATKLDGKYWAIAISEGDGNEAGIDQELAVGEDPKPVFQRLLKEYIADQPSAVKDDTNKNLYRALESKIENLTKDSDPDAKLDLFQAIKSLPESEQKNKLLNLLKTKAVNNRMTKIARIIKREDGYHVLSEKGKNLGGPYTSREKAEERLRQVEYFKHNAEFEAKILAWYNQQRFS